MKKTYKKNCSTYRYWHIYTYQKYIICSRLLLSSHSTPAQSSLRNSNPTVHSDICELFGENDGDYELTTASRLINKVD